MSPAPALVAGLYWLIAAVVLGAAVLVMHVYATWRVVRSDVEPSWWKWIAVVPPVTSDVYSEGSAEALERFVAQCLAHPELAPAG